MKQKGFVPIIILVLIALAVVGYFGYKNYWLKTQTLVQTTPTSIPSTTVDPTANWTTYTDTLGFEFKYPSTYSFTNSMINGVVDNGRVDFSTNSVSYLSLFRKNLIVYDFKNLCNDQTKVFPCILPSGWNQVTPVSDVLLGGKRAKSFYMTVTNGPDDAYHIVLTTETPYIELRMSVAGGGLDRTFNQILSTFKFLGQGQTANLNTIKTACIVLEGSSKAWDDIYKECDEGGATKVQLQTFCTTYGGKFEDNVDFCRHTTGPCGPAPTYTCSFGTIQ